MAMVPLLSHLSWRVMRFDEAGGVTCPVKQSIMMTMVPLCCHLYCREVHYDGDGLAVLSLVV